MIREICKAEVFLAQKAEAATTDDLNTAQDLLDTLIAHKDGCVGMAANMIGVNKPARDRPLRGDRHLDIRRCIMLKQLKYFQSVVRLGSFSAAAEENFISQSAISQQVQSLERELGFALLVRKNRSFSLTPAGEYFYRKSLLLTAACDRMCAEAAKIAKGEAANLKIGYLRTYAGGEFHRALAAFSARYPDVSVSIAYGSHGELCDMLSEDRVEITLNDQRRLFPTPTKI